MRKSIAIARANKKYYEAEVAVTEALYQSRPDEIESAYKQLYKAQDACDAANDLEDVE